MTLAVEKFSWFDSVVAVMTVQAGDNDVRAEVFRRDAGSLKKSAALIKFGKNEMK